MFSFCLLFNLGNLLKKVYLLFLVKISIDGKIVLKVGI
ncbi:hypothetical protein ES705_05377 [subsurface metagenome]